MYNNLDILEKMEPGTAAFDMVRSNVLELIYNEVEKRHGEKHRSAAIAGFDFGSLTGAIEYDERFVILTDGIGFCMIPRTSYSGEVIADDRRRELFESKIEEMRQLQKNPRCCYCGGIPDSIGIAKAAGYSKKASAGEYVLKIGEAVYNLPLVERYFNLCRESGGKTAYQTRENIYCSGDKFGIFYILTPYGIAGILPMKCGRNAKICNYYELGESPCSWEHLIYQGSKRLLEKDA